MSAACSYGEVITKYVNPDSLEVFASRVDKFYNNCGSMADDTLNDYKFCLILSKLKWRAEQFVTTRTDIEKYEDLKSALNTKLGDHTEGQTLAHKLGFFFNKSQRKFSTFYRLNSIPAYQT